MKHVLQNKKYKNRELEILSAIRSPAVVRLHRHFFSEEKDVSLGSRRVSTSIW
jgi:hypothetical protein